MKTSEELRNLLNRIDHKGYPAYKDTKGQYQFGTYVLSIDHVQGDPFASPSKVSVHIGGKQAGFVPVCMTQPSNGLHCRIICYEKLRQISGNIPLRQRVPERVA